MYLLTTLRVFSVFRVFRGMQLFSSPHLIRLLSTDAPLLQ
jgi:hypothetical protein